MMSCRRIRSCEMDSQIFGMFDRRGTLNLTRDYSVFNKPKLRNSGTAIVEDVTEYNSVTRSDELRSIENNPTLPLFKKTFSIRTVPKIINLLALFLHQSLDDLINEIDERKDSTTSTYFDVGTETFLRKKQNNDKNLPNYQVVNVKRWWKRDLTEGNASFTNESPVVHTTMDFKATKGSIEYKPVRMSRPNSPKEFKDAQTINDTTPNLDIPMPNIPAEKIPPSVSFLNSLTESRACYLAALLLPITGNTSGWFSSKFIFLNPYLLSTILRLCETTFSNLGALCAKIRRNLTAFTNADIVREMFKVVTHFVLIVYFLGYMALAVYQVNGKDLLEKMLS